MPAQQRSVLALIEGFRRPRADGAHGTQQAAYAVCEAIARAGRYEEMHLYRDSQQPALGELALPAGVTTRVFEKLRLRTTTLKYQAVYVANGQQMTSAPHLLRPRADWSPIVCSVGTAHSNSQWANLLLSMASGAIRESDGFIFKSTAAQRLFRSVCEDWSERFSLPGKFPRCTTVIPNGVDVAENVRSNDLRRQMRLRLRLEEEDVVFLSFSRLSPGTKGDFQALIVRWKQIREQFARAVLVMSGSNVDRPFVEDLRCLVRAAGVGDSVLIVADPFELAAEARHRLMSAADVFVHLSTGVEEASSLVVPEAMAHSLPVITSSWAGLPELVTNGREGFLVPTLAAPLPTYVAETLFGQAEGTHRLFAGKVVALDWSVFQQAALAMVDPEQRQRLGSAARLRAESHDLKAVAKQYIEFFARTSETAEEHSLHAAAHHPLVNLDSVTAAQASGTLDEDQLVRCGDRSRLHIVLSGLHPEAKSLVEALVTVISERREATLSELVLAVVGEQAREGETRCVATMSRLLVRLLNVGVIELSERLSTSR